MEQLVKQIDASIDQARLDLDKEVDKVSAVTTKHNTKTVDFLTHLFAHFVELPEIKQLQDEIIPRVEARIEMSIHDYLKFGEPDTHKPLELFIV